MNEKDIATARKAGAVEGGADNISFEVAPGRTDVLYCGVIEVLVHATLPALLLREHEPNKPRKRLGPSLACAWGFVRAVDGETVSNATWS